MQYAIRNINIRFAECKMHAICNMQYCHSYCYLHPTVSVALALASPSSLTWVHSYIPASLNFTSFTLSVPVLSRNSYFRDAGSFLPLNVQVTLDGGKLDTIQLKLAVSSTLTSADKTPRIRGASTRKQEDQNTLNWLFRSVMEEYRSRSLTLWTFDKKEPRSIMTFQRTRKLV